MYGYPVTRSWMAVVSALLYVICANSQAASAASAPGTWPDAWCRAEPGMNAEQLVKIMGAPTGKSDTTMTWSDHHYQFNAFLETSGTVRQLDINTYSLSDAEKASLKCEKVRTARTMANRAKVAKPARAMPDACVLVTGAEMSAILGTKVNAKASGSSKCLYQPASGSSPYVEFSVDWGDGAVAMAGAGFANGHEPGLTSPYDGIGDQAIAAGPALMIRTGEDLVTIVFSGVAQAPIAAKKIFNTAKAKM